MRSTALIGIVTALSSVSVANSASPPDRGEEFADDIGVEWNKSVDGLSPIKNWPPSRMFIQDDGFKENGSFPLRFHKSLYGHRFTVPVQIGDPPQRLELDLHIGMATTWVLGEDPVTEGGWPVADRKVWVANNHSEPLRSKKGFRNFDLWYPEKRAIQGTVYRDQISIGDGSEAFGSWHQQIGVAKKIHPRFASENGFAGVLGLGYRSDRGANLPESITTTLQERLGHAWRFSIAFKESGGHMDWNMHDTSRHTGDLFYTVYCTNHVPDGKQNSYHVINMTGYSFGSSKIRKEIHSAGMDSTSSYIVAPQPIAALYYSSIGAATRKVQLPTGHVGWEVPCKKKLPDFVVEFTNTTTRVVDELLEGPKRQGFRKYKIPGADLVLQKTETDEKTKKEWCLGAVVQNEEKLYPDFVLGWPFLKNKWIEFSTIPGIYIGEAS